jgi:histidyl-tRNA synthetase
MTNEKGLAPEVADKIWSYVQMHGILNRFYFWSLKLSFSCIGNADLINQLRTDAQLIAQKSAVAALNDLEILFRYLTLFGVMDKVTILKNEVFCIQMKIIFRLYSI